MTDAQFQPGQVVVIEGDRHSLLHRLIAWSQGWWWTHTFIVVGENRAVEATFPRVREFDLAKRLKEYELDGRARVVLDWYGLTDAQRAQIAAKARSYVGRWYNVFAVLWFFLFKTFNRTGGGSHWFCSRLITAAYRSGAGIDLTAGTRSYPGRMYARRAAMRDGYVTPAELLMYLGLITHAITDPYGRLVEMV